MENNYTLKLNGNEYDVVRYVDGKHDNTNLGCRNWTTLKAKAWEGGAVLLELLADAKAEKERADRLQVELVEWQSGLKSLPVPVSASSAALTKLKEQIKQGPLLTFENGLTINANEIVSVSPSGSGTSISTTRNLIFVDTSCTEVTQRWRAALYVEPLRIDNTVPQGIHIGTTVPHVFGNNSPFNGKMVGTQTGRYDSTSGEKLG